MAIIIAVTRPKLKPVPAKAPAPPPAKVLTLAVLPFEGADWGPGLADLVRSCLTANRNPAADFVLSGVVQDRAVEIRLNRVGQQGPLWSQRFEGPLAEMASAIALAAYEKTHLGSFSDRLARERTSQNPAALQLYLRGDYRGALRLDPRYAAAWAASGNWQKALAIDPSLPEGHAGHARALWTPAEHFPAEGVAAEDRIAIAGDTHLAGARSHLSWILLHTGDLPAALSEAHTAMEYDPGNPDYRFQLGVAQLYSGHFKEALDLFNTVPRMLHPLLWYWHASWVHLELHQTTRASYLLAEYDKQYGVDTDGVMSSVYAMLQARFNNPHQAALAIAAALEDPQDHGYFHHTAYFVSRAYTVLGQKSQAEFWMEQARKNGLPNPPSIP